MELGAGTKPGKRSGLSRPAMPAVTHVSTIDLIAETLGIDRERLNTLAYDNLEPEDGLILARDTDDKITLALTDYGIDLLKQLLEDLPQP